MRVQNVRELVNWLLVETPGWSREEIDQVIKSGERKDAKVAKPVPLYWVYVTAWATPDGVVQFRDDIYNRDGLGPAAASRGWRNSKRAGRSRNSIAANPNASAPVAARATIPA